MVLWGCSPAWEVLAHGGGPGGSYELSLPSQTTPLMPKIPTCLQREEQPVPSEVPLGLCPARSMLTIPAGVGSEGF